VSWVEQGALVLVLGIYGALFYFGWQVTGWGAP
jgi:hypothetical protein